MSVECFLDTNVIVCAATGRGVEDAKRLRALELIESCDFGLSAQVLQEFYVTVVHKIAVPLAPDVALEWIEQLEVFPCLQVDSALVKIAAELSSRHRVSYWDGAILAAAESLGAPLLYSEDFGHGRRYGSIQVVNPFL